MSSKTLAQVQMLGVGLEDFGILNPSINSQKFLFLSSDPLRIASALSQGIRVIPVVSAYKLDFNDIQL